MALMAMVAVTAVSVAAAMVTMQSPVMVVMAAGKVMNMSASLRLRTRTSATLLVSGLGTQRIGTWLCIRNMVRVPTLQVLAC